MHIVVLQRPDSVAPYDRWILEAAPAARITIVSDHTTARPDTDFCPGVRRMMVANYGTPEALTEFFKLCAEDRPDRIFVNTEDDVLPAAEARTIFDIDGQRSDIALLFRDKVRMKSLFRGASVPAVPYPASRWTKPLASLSTSCPLIMVSACCIWSFSRTAQESCLPVRWPVGSAVRWSVTRSCIHMGRIRPAWHA
jgi:hypothetical protein